MRFAGLHLGIPLLISASLAASQQPLDGPEMLRRPTLDVGSGRASPGRVIDMIRQFGGGLREMTHDCAAPQPGTDEYAGFSVRACRWGGRYPALLFEPVDAEDDSSLVLLASNGARLEVLFEGGAPASLVESLSGLLLEDFNEMYRELDDPVDG